MRKLLAAALLALALAPSAGAAGPAFGIRPVGDWKRGYFVYDGRPGARISGKVEISNSGDRAGTVKLFATDATTGQTSGTVYLTSGERPRGVGSWLSLAASRVELGPKEKRIVPFTLTAPRGARPGEHVGGIVAETLDRASGPQSGGKTRVQIKVRNLAIVAVQVNLPGPAAARFAIAGVRAGGRKGYQQVLVRLRNDGNVMRKPRGSLVLRNGKGDVVLRERFQLDTFLPRTAIDYPVNVRREALDVGTYAAEVELHYAGAGSGPEVVRATPTLRVTPQQVAQVFTSAAPPTPPPSAAPGGAPTGSRAGTPPPSASPAPKSPSEDGGGFSPLLIALLVAGGAALLGAGYVLALRTARRA